jgi:hypothetical protein
MFFTIVGFQRISLHIFVEGLWKLTRKRANEYMGQKPAMQMSIKM